MNELRDLNFSRVDKALGETFIFAKSRSSFIVYDSLFANTVTVATKQAGRNGVNDSLFTTAPTAFRPLEFANVLKALITIASRVKSEAKKLKKMKHT